MGPGRITVGEGIVKALQAYLGKIGNSISGLAQRAGVSKNSIGRVKVGNRIDAKTYARIAEAIGYAEAEDSVAVGANGQVFAQGPSGHVIHVTLSPGTSLTIHMDRDGVHASAGNGGGK